MNDGTFGPHQLLQVHRQQVPGDFPARRRIADAMRTLSERLIRMEADPGELEDWAGQLEALVEQIGERPRRTAKDANRRMFSGQASRADIFDMMDFDPVDGRSNPIAPGIRWDREDDTGVEGEIWLGEQYQGPPGRVHGGVIAWIMDAVLSRSMHVARRIGVTGTLTVRYMAPTRIEVPLRCSGRIERMEGRKMFIHGAIHHDDVQTVHAEGIFFQPEFMVDR